VSACKSLKTGATEQFGKDYSCPEDRVEAREREDVRGSTLFIGPSTATPPEEVKKDPARLAKWRADQAESQKGAIAVYDGMTVFEVTGCQHRAFYACSRANKVNGNADPVHCFAAPYPPK
jgi:hypothetical protein